MRINASVRVGSDMTVGALADVLESIPNEATISVYTYAGDRPFESGYSELKFNWEV